MKKFIAFLLMTVAPISLFAQFKVVSDGRAMVKGSNIEPASLTVGESNYVYPNTTYWMGAFAKALQEGSRWTIGVMGEAHANTSSSSGRSFGVLGIAGNASSGYNYGVTGIISGSNNGSGIYGSIGSYYNSIPGQYAGYFRGATYVNGTLTATSVVTPSDIRLKTNITSLCDSERTLDNVLCMNVISYNYKEQELPKIESDTAQAATIEAQAKWNEKNRNRHYGLSAQELQEIYPDLVEEGQDGYLGVNYVELVPILIRSIQELKEELDELKGPDTAQNSPAKTSTTSLGKASLHSNRLFQNTPNPFNEQTVIRFQLADNTQDAAICIFDMQGKMLKRLPIASGERQVTIGSYELGEGMFLYSLFVNGQEIDTKKMVISK